MAEDVGERERKDERGCVVYFCFLTIKVAIIT